MRVIGFVVSLGFISFVGFVLVADRRAIGRTISTHAARPGGTEQEAGHVRGESQRPSPPPVQRAGNRGPGTPPDLSRDWFVQNLFPKVKIVRKLKTAKGVPH
jgi:hypothetical protein